MYRKWLSCKKSEGRSWQSSPMAATTVARTSGAMSRYRAASTSLWTYTVDVWCT